MTLLLNSVAQTPCTGCQTLQEKCLAAHSTMEEIFEQAQYIPADRGRLLTLIQSSVQQITQISKLAWRPDNEHHRITLLGYCRHIRELPGAAQEWESAENVLQRTKSKAADQHKQVEAGEKTRIQPAEIPDTNVDSVPLAIAHAIWHGISKIGPIYLRHVEIECPVKDAQQRLDVATERFWKICDLIELAQDALMLIGQQPEPGQAAIECAGLEKTSEQYFHNADFTMVNWYGTEYKFSIGLQSRVVNALWKEYTENGLGLHQETINTRINAEKDNFRLKHVFRNHPAFRTMIQSDGRGTFRLVPPKQSK